MSRSHGGKERGSALIIVLVIATAALVATYGILESSLNSRVSVLRTVDGDLSDGIARAGMERAVAYLQAFGAADYDRVLDPNLNAACAPPVFTAGVGGHQPVFTEAGVVKDVAYPDDGVNQRTYTLVPYNGGAYLIRFEDDADDMVRVPGRAAFTNNTVSAGLGDPACVEGIEAAAPTLLTPVPGGIENPVRDRNRTIWIEVIGIYPGTDVDSVGYKTVLRKRHAYVPPAQVAGIQVAGNIQVTGTGDLYACSPIGSLEVGGDVQATGAGDMCACGDSLANQWQGVDHCTDTTWCRVPCAPGTLQAAPVAVTNPGLLAAAPDYYFDWDRPCLFYIDTVADNLWFWESTANKGPNAARCGDFEGEGYGGALPWPPNPAAAGVAGSATDPANWRGCWAPLILAASAPTCASIAGEGVDDGGQCAWRPDDDVVIEDLAGLGAPLNALGFPAGMTQVRKPAWGNECFVNYPPYGTTQDRYSCDADCLAGDGKCCNGARSAFRFHTNVHGGMLWFYQRGPMPPADNAGNRDADRRRLAAVPAGVYIVAGGGDWTPSGQGDFNPLNFPVPTSGNLTYPDHFPLAGQYNDPPMAGFPLATMVFDDDIGPQIGFWFGIGQGFSNPETPGTPANDYASLVVNNGNATIIGNSNVSFAGSIVLNNGNLEWQGNAAMSIFGGVFVLNNNWIISGTGQYEWFYTDSLAPPPPLAGGAPLIHRARQ